MKDKGNNNHSGAYYDKLVWAVLEIQNSVIKVHKEKGDFEDAKEGILAIAELVNDMLNTKPDDIDRQMILANRIATLSTKFLVEMNPNKLKSLRHEQN